MNAATRYSLTKVFHLADIARSFGLSAQRWRGLTAAMFDHYHPERHYMRGPGPKWREKHATRLPTTA